ncbi:Alkaline phosphatase synthesis sensor protein PhoR [Lentilactobacillus parabuchneri]|uniref:histidine kinase n=2 Tax=Lentilactobacillus parabuchneri TaxID=152331 RepID=A0A1X1FHH4_9LACO|nr:HAMP domain-containing sensor histidine kinase [Lentilactobacillus parabuchneri]APR06572.1 Alkaline phosphatase synthesis sensor protein PhoR [Lentilactobacillus parabuchneri]KRM46512.1 integral membrane sensor signal transduction histidine kinase [Lentilactobacillus parabuchneri DSM 5707 = NBRC 107865]KRN79413.1 integral membrane sensor signal transduction histidine kinase [Lentilactobacillus parabuchneri]MBW0223325.1 HAMP domain-containing histidine kinase [Lentilactobacillus parabuchneri]
MKLTGREKTELFLEGVVTVILLLLLNLSIIVLINQSISTNPGLRDGIFIIKRSIIIGPDHLHLWSWENIFIVLMILFDAAVVYWRLIRRYHQMQLRHIISELHYIANGHLNHRIPFKLKGNTQSVVESINALVDSVIQSMDEERAIESSKDELITNVSHDLRTPLTSILGYLGLIRDKQYHSQEDLLKYADIAYLKAKQMKSLVDNLFEYTKVKQTGTPLSISKIDLNQMMEQLVASFELEADKSGLAISAQETDQPMYIEADAEKLGRVFNNLISNAIKYGKGGHHIYLSCATGQPGEVVIHVANDGPEIPKKSLNQIFERFYRVESSRNKDTGGSGLGLAIAQSIIDLHGGYINVSSDQGLTTFAIHLPAKHGDQLKNPIQKAIAQ